MLWQIYDQIYMENFERTRKEEQQRAREAAEREQQAAWGPPPAGPPGLQNPGWGAEGAGNGWQGGGRMPPFRRSRPPLTDCCAGDTMPALCRHEQKKSGIRLTSVINAGIICALNALGVISSVLMCFKMYCRLGGGAGWLPEQWLEWRPGRGASP